MGTNARKRRRLVVHSVIVVILILGIGYGVWWAISPTSPEVTRAYFENPNGSRSREVSLEIADTDAERAKGLMFRREMPRDHGMLFVFPEETPQSFWMRNTYLSLDMIFLDASSRVVSLLEGVPPLNDEPRRSGKPAKFVVELNAGEAAREGIVVGSRLVRN